ncbi:hypothetical protein [Bacillus tropicus]
MSYGGSSGVIGSHFALLIILSCYSLSDVAVRAADSHIRKRHYY